MSDDIHDLDTTSVPRGDGVRDLMLTDRWNTPLGTPNGGYLLAAMLRGLREEMQADDPLVAAVTYLASPEPGPAELRTTSLRRGRRVQTGEAGLFCAERHVAQLTASFGPRTGGRTLELGGPPHLPDPDACVDPWTARRPGGLADRVEQRLASRPGWLTGTPSGDPTVEAWQRLAGGRAIDFPALAFLCDSLVPPVLEIGETRTMTVQLTVHLHRLPVPGWIATRVTTRHVVEGFHDEDCELWDEAGNLVAQSRQLAILL